jgi:H+/Cl- antiporter ClcA
MQAVASFGIGLAFDPFDQQQKWNERPTWQKFVLYFHLAIVAGLFGLAVGLNDK